ncbi:MAG: TRAP transporter small permease [Phyllobacterium sp.]
MKIIARLTDWLAAVPLFILLVVFNVAVVMRYWFGQPLQWTEEIAGLLMIWIVMIGGVAAERTDQHLTIPVLVDLLSPKVGAFVNLLVSVLSAGFLFYVAYVGLRLAMRVQFKVTDVLRVSYFWIDIAVPVGFVVIALYTLHRGIKTARIAFQGEAQ